MIFDSTTIGNLTMIAVGFSAAFLAALWLSLIIWTFKDIRRRARDPLVRILAALVVSVLFLPGILIYLILRPSQTLEEEYQQSLEEEALLQNIEDSPLCPGCNRRIQSNWMVCPSCHTRLKKKCSNCGNLMELPWNLCPFCAAPTPGTRREKITLDEALQSLPKEPSEPESEPSLFPLQDKSAADDPLDPPTLFDEDPS
jgi:RNA polymerase subunit RPABC4/transcription elongation factor Spt4